ncbi:hypothetical protein PB01_10580 [Psychrobacillus glaciei]|uniref:Lipoprotein n=1 Tax=Psychrobacillus glaciei TaxID=2283160 RepID=A0A5J6SMS3_9BACI|nr:hypothetical protein [Psychrobacillus glaciei]QFF99241.1 hypothetical protein PB01_10580 [Psychrobacillus glaciei]
MKIIFLSFAMLVFSTLWITGCSNGSDEKNKKVEGSKNEFPPSMTGSINVNDKEYEMVVGNYRWVRKQGLDTQIVETDAASPFQIAENFSTIMVEPNTNINIEIEESPRVSLYLWNENGREKEVTLKNNQLLSPTSKGKYIFEIIAKWSNGEVSYTFVLEVI